MGDHARNRISEREFEEALRPWGGEKGLEPPGDEGEQDDSDLPEELPEHVTDDDVFSERDFETIERAFPAEGDPFWDVKA